MVTAVRQIGPTPDTAIGHVANHEVRTGRFPLVEDKRELNKHWDDLLEVFKISNFASLFSFNDKVYSFPIVEGTEKEKAINVTDLRKITSKDSDKKDPFVVLSPNARDVATAVSDITYIDGEAGVLRHRGYDAKELAQKSSFAEVIYLLLKKTMPEQPGDLKDFEARIVKAMDLPDSIIEMIRKFPKDKVHPMNAISAMVAALEDNSKPDSRDLSEENAINIIGKTLAITALLVKKYQGKAATLAKPKENLGLVENFVQMIFGQKVTQNADYYETLLKTFNQLLILHADHEQNCSAFTARVVASSDAGPYAAISAANNALYGPAHGGANQKVLGHLAKIRALPGDKIGDKVKSVVAAIEEDGKAKKLNRDAGRKKDDADFVPENNFSTLLDVPESQDKIMGWGHAVYKEYDPRADFIKKACDKLIPELRAEGKIDDETWDFYQIAKKLEPEALNNDYFIKRQLYPNVDFYSGILYKALKIPTEVFTVMFSAGRTPGWLAQIQEQKERPETSQIVRPRQIYVGNTKRDYDGVVNATSAM